MSSYSKIEALLPPRGNQEALTYATGAVLPLTEDLKGILSRICEDPTTKVEERSEDYFRALDDPEQE